MTVLIFCGDLKYCPYITRYTERMDLKKAPYTVLFWNRGGYKLNLPENYRYYNSPSELKKNKIKKAIDFLGFRKWLLSEITRINPQRIVALSSLTGVILGKKLYGGRIKYVFDIRDYSYEHIPLFYNLEKRIIRNSCFTAISSKGFQAFLPEADYVIAHNFNRSDIKEGARFAKTSGTINFVWNGVVRFFDYQKQYLDALKNDDRFQVVFHGDGPELEQYKEYCEKNGFKNVRFTGAYNNINKAELLRDAHILNNCYGYLSHAGNKLKYAVSNRFYDGMIFHIPQIVEPEGYKPEWALKSGIGINLRVSDTFADDLYNYYLSINANEFDKCCELALQSVIDEDDRFIKSIDLFIDSK